MSGKPNPKIYIDGQEGTTALTIRSLLADRRDIELLLLPASERKNESSRREMIADCELVILCLPDDAAKQAASWAVEHGTRVIDASTAHRVSQDWVYGLPELTAETRQEVASATRVSNPGCYPTSVILALSPLIEEKLLQPDHPIFVHALSGYSGGGRKLIERWEDSTGNLSSLPYSAPYSFSRRHKHIAEMMHYSGLTTEPVFLPRVGAFRQGMRVEIPLHGSMLPNKSDCLAASVHAVLSDRYRDEPFVQVNAMLEGEPDEHRFDPRLCNGTNRVELTVCAHPSGHVLLFGVLDNLGKGAGAAAVQSMNLMLGFEEQTGLIIHAES